MSINTPTNRTTLDHDNNERDTAVGHWLSLLWRTAQAIRLYSPDHPKVWEMAEQTHDAWTQCDPENNTIHLTLSPDGFALQSRPLELNADTAELAKLLATWNIAAIEFKHAMTAQQIVAVAHCLTNPTASSVDQPNELCLADASDGAINALLFDSDQLRLQDGSRRDGNTPAIPWHNLIGAMIGSDVDSDASPQQLAKQINEQAEAAQPDKIHELRQALEHAATQPNSDSTHHVRQFVDTLNPLMRNKLMGTAPCNTPRSLAFVSEVAEVLETDEIISAMNSVQDKGLQVTPETLRMCRKLALCLGQQQRTESDRGTIRDQLQQLEQQINSLGSYSVDDLTELFERRSTDEYTPDDYRDMLDQLTDATSPTGSDIESIADESSTHVHAIDTAVVMLQCSDPQQQPESPGVMEFIRNHLDALIECSQPNTLASALEQARRWAEQSACEPTRVAAQSLADEISNPRVAFGLLAHSRHTPANTEQVVALIRCDTTDDIIAILSHLTEVSGPRVLKPLYERIAAVDPAILLAAARELAQSDEAGPPQALIRFARHAEQNHAEPILHTLMSHTDTDVCLAAAQVLYDRDWLTSDTIDNWMNDPREPIQRFAVRCLVQSDSEASIDRIGRYLEGKLTDQPPSRSQISHLVQTAATQSPAALSRICGTLLQLTESLRPSHTRLARRLASALITHGNTEQARQSIIAWRFSFTRLIGVIYEGGAWCIRAIKR